jgi:hypothetical protein
MRAPRGRAGRNGAVPIAATDYGTDYGRRHGPECSPKYGR